MSVPIWYVLWASEMEGTLDKQETGRRLRMCRAYANKNRDEIAEALGVSANTYGRWERGDTAISPLAMPEVRRIMAEECGTAPELGVSS